MRKYLIYSTLLLTLLSSCSIDWNDNKMARINELEEQVTTLKTSQDKDYFNKKQECNKEYDKIMKEENNMDVDGEARIDSLFYSPEKNSCLYAITRTTYYNQGKPDSDTWTWFIIKDAYTHEMIYTSQMIAINKQGLDVYNRKETDYKNSIKELQ